MATMSTTPLVVIVGVTASGKSALSMELAKKFNGEIICADSRTLYRGMNIGTAKPSPADQKQIHHHLLDVIEPNEDYNVARFQADALSAIADVSERGKVPILVGGSGLYIDSVIFSYRFSNKNTQKRSELDKLTLEELQEMAQKTGITEDQIDFKNRRHLQRAVEAGGVNKADTKLRGNTLVLGVNRDKKEIEARIEARIDHMVNDGFVEEVRALDKQNKRGLKAFDAPGYRAFFQYLDGQINLEQAKAEFARNDKLLAKRQRTWFKRNKSIHWVNNWGSAVALTTTFLNNLHA